MSTLAPRIAGKLGMIPAPLPKEIGLLSTYLANPLGVPPAQVAWPASLSSCGMLGNDTFGDCTLAGAVHLDMACAAITGEVRTFPDAQETIDQYEQITGGADSGCVEAEVLRRWQGQGLFGGLSKIAGFAPLDIYEPDELKAAVALFGATYVGIKVPANAQAQFAARQAWHLDGSPADHQSVGGHCVVKVGYYMDAAWGNVWALLTWGTVQLATEQWLAGNLLEDWAVLSQEFVQAAPGVVNVAALQDDIAKLSA